VTTLSEPSPADPSWPRYTRAPFPPYRFVPGRSPHPRTDPRGHSYGRPEPRIQALDPDRWAESALYLRGVDLFNFAYWWESHEAFEALWRGARAGSPVHELLQALIQLAASELKRFDGHDRAARALGERALERLGRVPSPYLGLDVAALARDASDRLAGARPGALLLALPLPPADPGSISRA
jgi:hypothetical protein